MINLGISIGSFIVLFSLIKFPFNFSILASILPALVAFFATYITLARKSFKKFEGLIMLVQNELQRQATLKNQNLRSIEGAINILKSGYPLGNWQFFIKAQIDAQIGVIYYINDKTKEAFPYLKNSFLRHWVARGMLAAYYFREKKYDEAKTVFKEALKVNKKTALLYNIYAWCLMELKEKDAALNVIQQGLKILPQNQELQKVLMNLQNDKDIRLKGYGDEWYQFRLEKHPNEIMMQKPMFKQSKKQTMKRQ